MSFVPTNVNEDDEPYLISHNPLGKEYKRRLAIANGILPDTDHIFVTMFRFAMTETFVDYKDFAKGLKIYCEHCECKKFCRKCNFCNQDGDCDACDRCNNFAKNSLPGGSFNECLDKLRDRIATFDVNNTSSRESQRLKPWDIAAAETNTFTDDFSVYVKTMLRGMLRDLDESDDDDFY